MLAGASSRRGRLPVRDAREATAQRMHSPCWERPYYLTESFNPKLDAGLN